MGRDKEDPAIIPESRNWSGEICESCSRLVLSMNVNEVG